MSFKPDSYHSLQELDSPEEQGGGWYRAGSELVNGQKHLKPEVKQVPKDGVSQAQGCSTHSKAAPTLYV